MTQHTCPHCGYPSGHSTDALIGQCMHCGRDAANRRVAVDEDSGFNVLNGLVTGLAIDAALGTGLFDSVPSISDTPSVPDFSFDGGDTGGGGAGGGF